KTGVFGRALSSKQHLNLPVTIHYLPVTVFSVTIRFDARRLDYLRPARGISAHESAEFFDRQSARFSALVVKTLAHVGQRQNADHFGIELCGDVPGQRR